MKHFCHIVDEINSCRAPERRTMLAKPKRGTSFLYLVSKREIGEQGYVWRTHRIHPVVLLE
jgi:hypothetical protein